MPLFIIQKLPNDIMVAENTGLRDFFVDKGYRQLLRVDGKRGVTIQSDGDINIKWSASEIMSCLNFKDSDEFFGLPKGVQSRVWSLYLANFDACHLTRFVLEADKPILQSALPCSSGWNTHVKDEKWNMFRDVFDRIPDRKLVRLYRKFDSDWTGDGADSLAELFPFRVLPLLVNTVNEQARVAIEKRLKEGK